MNNNLSMTLPAVELTSVKMAQSLNRLLRVATPIFSAFSSYARPIAGVALAMVAYAANLYDMAYGSTTALVLMAVSTVSSISLLLSPLFSMKGGEV